ncbi:MAG: glycosyltransferase [Candidatus Andersenbacteria bacterium]|nr:glycosyltransferase [Candidatus Andersenbacteria bacterium]
MQKVSIVIVNWNTGGLLAQCIASISKLPELDMIRHVVIVDNNSIDGSLDKAQNTDLQTATFLSQQQNLGFSKATNLGIQYVHEHGGQDDHILLLNPDTEVRPDAIKNMVAVLSRNSKAGIVGAKLSNADGTVQKSVRRFPTLSILATLFLKMQRIIPNAPFWKKYMMVDFDYSQEQSVNQVMGAGFLIRNEVIKQIGVLDEQFWIWFEEVDYCRRAKNNGWETIYTPHAEIMHYGGVSFNQLYGAKKTAPFLHSALVYARKHLGAFSYAVLVVLYPIAYAIAVLIGTTKHSSRFAWASIALVSALFIALFISMQLGVAVLAFTCVAWWVWDNPEEGLLLLIVLSPLLPLLKVTQTLGDITLVKDVIIVALFFKTFLVPLFNKTLPYRKNSLLAPIIALSGWAIIEALHASSHVLAVLRLRDILLYILLYFAVLYLPHTKKIMATRFAWFLATLVVVMMLGIIQLKSFPDSTVLRFDPARQIWIPRMGSTFGHPTPFAEFLITTEMLCIGYILAGYKHARNRIIIIATLLATLPLLYFTYTRASWIALIIGALSVFATLIWKRTGGITIQKKHIAVTLATLLIAGAGIFQFSHVGTFLRSAFDPTYASNAARFGFITQLIAQTSNTDAIIGKGLGSSITQTAMPSDVTAADIATGDSRTIQLSKDATLVDNQYLKTFIEMGVIGVVFTAWLFWRFFITSLRLIKNNQSGITRLLGIMGVGFITSFVIQALFVDIWDVYPTNAIFWVLAAIISQQKMHD